MELLCVCVHAKLLQSYLTLCNLMDCSPPGSSVHGIFQASILEWVAMPSSRGSSQYRNQTGVSCITGRFFTNWAIKEALYYIYYINVCMDLYTHTDSQQSLHLSSLKKTMRFGTSLVIQLLKICLPMQRTWIWLLLWEDLGFYDSSVGKESVCNAGDPGLISRLRRSAGEGIATHSSILGLPLWLSW